MRIAVMGSGGLGGYFGARLASGGADVRFIARGKHLQAMRSEGDHRLLHRRVELLAVGGGVVEAVLLPVDVVAIVGESGEVCGDAQTGPRIGETEIDAADQGKDTQHEHRNEGRQHQQPSVALIA